MKTIITLFIWISMAAGAWSAPLLDNWYSDRTARRVGDLLTVQIEEQSTVQKDSSNDREKSLGGKFSFDLPSLVQAGNTLWEALSLPEWTVDGSKNFSASGSKQNTDVFSALITVNITEVLPNGNLMIMGGRKVNIDGDILQFTLTGTVRPDDVDRMNTVLSTRIAGAAISYETIGEFASNQRKGLVSRVVDLIMPF